MWEDGSTEMIRDEERRYDLRRELRERGRKKEEYGKGERLRKKWTARIKEKEDKNDGEKERRKEGRKEVRGKGERNGEMLRRKVKGEKKERTEGRKEREKKGSEVK